jgi:PHD/YefM family antitoxin component YafN of YafNO toxin-antitoxin module
MSSSAQFITTDQGEKKVILPASEYEELLEDLADLAVVAERSGESTSSLEQVIARLKSDGLL